MIVTLTLNPAIDTTVIVTQKDQANEPILSQRSDVGGKGINVSKTLQALGQESHAVIVTAGKNGETINTHLKALNLSFKAFEIPGETRENQKIISDDDGSMVEKNEPGPKVPEGTLDALIEYLDGLLKPSDLCVLSGSIPPGLESDTYQRIIQRLKPQGIKTILDASGEPFKKGVLAGPTFIKPNHLELAEYLNEPTSKATIQKGMDQLHTLGVDRIFVTCGKDGAYASDHDHFLYAAPLPVKVQSTVGAGDAFVAGLAMTINDSLDTQLRWASAIASATTETPGTTPPTKKAVETFHTHIQLKEEERS